MKKFLSVVILIMALVISGCGEERKMTVDSSTPDKITVTATNASNGGCNGHIKVPEGSAIQVDAKISSGTLIIRMLKDEKEYTINKSGESFIDVPPGEYYLMLSPKDGLTGEIILRAAPKN